MVFTYKIQKFTDIETSTTQVTMLNVGVSGNEIRDRCLPFLNAFKYYRVVGSKVSLLPASTLPADPSQISYESGENSVNPADMMNVGLIRYTNGESFPYYYKLTGKVDAGTEFDNDVGMQTYFNMMLDRRWSKFGLQRGVHRFFRPYVYEDGLPIQSVCPDEQFSYVKVSDGSFAVKNSQTAPSFVKSTVSNEDGLIDDYSALSTNKALTVPPVTMDQYPPLDRADLFGTSNAFRMQTGKMRPLGWRTTDIAHDNYAITGNDWLNYPWGIKGFNTFPLINMGRIILPRALKTKFAFRVVETIIVQFRGAINVSANNALNYKYLADRGIYPSGKMLTDPDNTTGGPFWGGNQK